MNHDTRLRTVVQKPKHSLHALPPEYNRTYTAAWLKTLVLLASLHGVLGYISSLPTHFGSMHCGNPHSCGSQSLLSVVPTQQSSLPKPSPLLATEPLVPTKKKSSKKGSSSKPSGDNTATSTQTETKRKKKSNEPTHWIVESDEVVFQQMDVSLPHAPDHSGTQTSLPAMEGPGSAGTAPSESTIETISTHSLLRFTVRGNPLPLRRHRTSRGFVYNPSAQSQKTFREAVEQLVFTRTLSDVTSTADLDSSKASATTVIAACVPQQPLWGPEHVLAVTIVFRMKRPNTHFIGGKREPHRLRPTAPSQTSGTLRTDVDNLAKFVLDSLNGVLYADDRQIASLHVTKLFDNDVDELCLGSTCVCVRVLQDKDVSRLLANSLNLF